MVAVSVSVYGGQVLQCGNDAQQLDHVGIVLGQDGLQFLQTLLENELVALGKQREFVIEIVDEKRAFFKNEPQLLVFQHLAVLIAQDREQHLVQQLLLDRRPVDVEVAGIGRGLSVLQHVDPPAVLGAFDAHVIGNDIEDLPHAVALQFRGQCAA